MGTHDGVSSPTTLLISPIAFHCMSVISQEPNFKSIESDPYSRRIIRNVLAECQHIALQQNCSFPQSNIQHIMQKMIVDYPPPESDVDPSQYTTMYQDLLAGRPLEFEVYLGNPVRMAETLGLDVPNLQLLYAIARHINRSRTRSDGQQRSPALPPPRSSPKARAPVAVARPPPQGPRATDLELRNRELMLRERELQVREREMEISRRRQNVRYNVPSTIMDDDEDDDGTTVPRAPVSQRSLMMNDNFDMMTVTGRRSRNNKPPPREKSSSSGGGRLMSFTRGTRAPSRAPSVVSQATFDPLNENPLMGFTSNRYPGVDTRTLAANSRANSLTSQRMDELRMSNGTSYPPHDSRYPPTPDRAPLPPSDRGGYPPNGYPQPSYPPRHAPYSNRGGPVQRVPRQQYDPPPPNEKDLLVQGKVLRSTTGSASASSASLGGTGGESHSSSSSLEHGPRY
jgi:Ketopantoate reductase PanE/ApbA C terminal